MSAKGEEDSFHSEKKGHTCRRQKGGFLAKPFFLFGRKGLNYGQRKRTARYLSCWEQCRLPGGGGKGGVGLMSVKGRNALPATGVGCSSNLHPNGGRGKEVVCACEGGDKRKKKVAGVRVPLDGVEGRDGASLESGADFLLKRGPCFLNAGQTRSLGAVWGGELQKRKGAGRGGTVFCCPFMRRAAPRPPWRASRLTCMSVGGGTPRFSGGKWKV